ncbi:MAG: DUF4124 domain-containing protein [Gammaproteobacteria bacterium]
MNRLNAALQSSVRILGIYLLAGHAYAAMYKWVDEEGNVQYTQSPPPAGIEAETIKPPPAVDSDAAIKQMHEDDKKAGELLKQREEQVDKDAQEAAKVAMQKKNCEMAKARLESYTRPRIRFVQEDGSRVTATEEERQEQIKKSEDMIKEFCKE